MHQRETAQQHDDELLNDNWRKGVTSAGRYEKHRLKFLQILQNLNAIWDRDLGRLAASSTRTELTSDDVRHVYGARNRAVPTTRQFAANVIDRTLEEDITKPATS